MLRYPLADRKSLTALTNLRVRAPNGIEAPLGEVATIELGKGYPTIKRADRARIKNRSRWTGKVEKRYICIYIIRIPDKKNSKELSVVMSSKKRRVARS